ncbi:MAG: DNA-formamidopyrimidine glycosylase [Bacilli bacterium]|nr:DNA-formamidopyrimidine glycosylase [Bacilli bacterium]
MPELPEVETVKRILLEIIKGKRVENIICLRDKTILSGAEEFISSLKGETINDVTRKGKFLIFHFTHEKVVISHLRMEGKYFEGKKGEAPDKHDLLIYEFSDGTTLRYNDVRKFGIMILSDESSYLNEPPLSELGKEPWDFKEGELASLFKNDNRPIKEALLDQTKIAGLGNIYDDEVLFATKIHPLTPAKEISEEKYAEIVAESSRILKMAIANGGSTIKSYHPKEGVSGMMQNELLAYGKGNTPCPRCGFIMHKISVGGRGTVYCPICQKIKESDPLIVGVTGPIASGKSTVSKYLKKKGYEIIDADELVKEIYEREDIEKILSPLNIEGLFIDKKLNRAVLTMYVLENEVNKKALEDIVHPLVYEMTLERIKKSKKKRIALDVPLLIDNPLEKLCDLIIAIFAEEKIQKERLLQRGKEPEIAMKINKGWPKGKVKKAAGLVLDGNGSEEDLLAELDKATYL